MFPLPAPQVTDPNHPTSTWTYNPNAGAAANGTSQLACSEFQHCSSFDGDGVDNLVSRSIASGGLGARVAELELQSLQGCLKKTGTLTRSSPYIPSTLQEDSGLGNDRMSGVDPGDCGPPRWAWAPAQTDTLQLEDLDRTWASGTRGKTSDTQSKDGRCRPDESNH